jgi:phosphonate transport system substrate-binding protein
MLGLALTPALPTLAQPAPQTGAALRFGILPLGDAFESRLCWEPLLADLARAIERPVSTLSVTSYGALDQAMRRDEVDLAFLPGTMALDAVRRNRMKVIAQAAHREELPGYRALLLARKDTPPMTLAEVLDAPGRWRLAHSERQSMSGYVVPQLELFLPHRIEMETRFRNETIGTHQFIALAVANGDADIGTGSTADYKRFQRQFPVEARRLRVLWESDPIPNSQIVIRGEFPAPFQQRVRDFFTAYGCAGGPKGEAERAALKSLHELAGFLAADNRSLIPAARIVHALAEKSALNAQWINENARARQLRRIEEDYAQTLSALDGQERPAVP